MQVDKNIMSMRPTSGGIAESRDSQNRTGGAILATRCFTHD